MKFNLEVAEIVDGELHLRISAEDGTRVEDFFSLRREIRGKDREDVERQFINELASHARNMIDEMSRPKEWSGDLPEPIKPRILVALQEQGYDVE